MNNSIFFQILSSWEVIAAIVVFLLILPFTFFIASYDKFRTIEFVGLKKKKKSGKPGKKEKTETGENKENQEDGQTKQKTGARKQVKTAAKNRKPSGSTGKAKKDTKAEKKPADEYITGKKSDIKWKKDQKKDRLTKSEENFTEEE